MHCGVRTYLAKTKCILINAEHEVWQWISFWLDLSAFLICLFTSVSGPCFHLGSVWLLSSYQGPRILVFPWSESCLFFTSWFTSQVSLFFMDSLLPLSSPSLPFAMEACFPTGFLFFMFFKLTPKASPAFPKARQMVLNHNWRRLSSAKLCDMRIIN